jgi:hypothetical protein
MPEQEPDKLLSGVSTRTNDGDFGFVHKSNEPRIVQPEARACNLFFD